MSLESEFGSTYNSSDLEKHGKRLLDKYGRVACEEAAELESTNLSEGSLSSYKPQVRDIISTVGDANPDVEEALQAIQDCDKEGSTKSIMVSAIKKYYEAIGEIDKADNFNAKAKKSDIDNEAFSGGMDIDEWVTVDEVERIDDNLFPEDGVKQVTVGGGNNQWIITMEHKAMFETLYYTGCRVGELPLLQIDDFNFKNNEVQVYRLKKSGKKPKRDMIAIPQEYVDTMQSYLDMYNLEEGDVFRYCDRTIQNRMIDLNEAYKFTFGPFEHTEDMTPHKLRHARVTAIANTSGIDKAGEFVDHSSVETTKAYRHLAVEEQRDILPEEQDDSDGSDDIIGFMTECMDDGQLDEDSTIEYLVDSKGMDEDEAEKVLAAMS